MKLFPFLLISLLPLSSFAATVSGEKTLITKAKPTTTSVVKITTITTKPKAVTVVSTAPATVTIAHKYITGPKGGCYYLVKDKKTGKMVNKYVNKSLCKK